MKQVVLKSSTPDNLQLTKATANAAENLPFNMMHRKRTKRVMAESVMQSNRLLLINKKFKAMSDWKR